LNEEGEKGVKRITPLKVSMGIFREEERVWA